jgi:hypothetical protein
LIIRSPAKDRFALPGFWLPLPLTSNGVTAVFRLEMFHSVSLFFNWVLGRGHSPIRILMANPGERIRTTLQRSTPVEPHPVGTLTSLREFLNDLFVHGGLSIFPQLTGLGHSSMAQRYAIRDLEQA